MTAIFTVGKNGNGTVYYNKTKEEVDKLIDEYEKAGWKVSFDCYSKAFDSITYVIE